MSFVTTLSFPIIIFLIGLNGIFLNRKNILLIIICVELVLLSLNFSFLIVSFYLDDVLGQIFAIFILTVASAETRWIGYFNLFLPRSRFYLRWLLSCWKISFYFFRLIWLEHNFFVTATQAQIQ